MNAQLDGALPPPKGIDLLQERPARGLPAGDLNLLTLIGDNKLAKLGAATKKKSEADEADSEAGDMISRLQTAPVEPGAAELAKQVTSAAIRGDAKTLEKLVTAHKKDDAFEDAIDLAWDALKETGVNLSWHSDHERLLLSRFPSIWANGPQGAGYSVSAKGEKMETYKVERRPPDPFGIDEGYKFEVTATLTLLSARSICCRRRFSENRDKGACGSTQGNTSRNRVRKTAWCNRTCGWIQQGCRRKGRNYAPCYCTLGETVFSVAACSAIGK